MKRYLFLLVFIPLYAYAIIRYHFGKEISFEEWFFILNKAIAWTAITSIGLSVLNPIKLAKIKTDRRTTGMTGFVLALVHLSGVLILFNKAHFEKLYQGDHISLQGWSAISIGIISLLIFSAPFYAALKNLPNENKIFRLGKIGFIVSLTHPMIIGASGWFTSETWPYYMPPITLLAVLIGILLLIFRK